MAGSKMFKNNNLMLNAATTATNDALGKVLNSLNGVENFAVDYARPNQARSP